MVVDPVMVAESGAVLLDDEARAALVERLLPLATVVTPNIPEARALTGLGEEATPGGAGARGAGARPARRSSSPAATARTAADVFFDGEAARCGSPGERHPGGASHGSGCTHSSALAALLARGETPLEAAREAREIASEAVGAGLRGIGAGAGPVDVLGRAARTR